MSTSKLTIDELESNRSFEATFWKNPNAESKFKLRATHLDGRRAPKVVLTSDPKILPGVPCMVRVSAVHKVERTDHGDRGAVEANLFFGLTQCRVNMVDVGVVVATPGKRDLVSMGPQHRATPSQ